VRYHPILTHISEPTPCPYCAKPNNGHSCDGRTPQTGDYSICWSCHKVSVFVAGPLGLAVRKPTEGEAAAMATDEGFAARPRRHG
jgi:hypothetical protein